MNIFGQDFKSRYPIPACIHFTVVLLCVLSVCLTRNLCQAQLSWLVYLALVSANPATNTTIPIHPHPAPTLIYHWFSIISIFLQCNLESYVHQTSIWQVFASHKIFVVAGCVFVDLRSLCTGPSALLLETFLVVP